MGRHLFLAAASPRAARGGGIFYDHHDSGDWDRDFAFTNRWAKLFSTSSRKSSPPHGRKLDRGRTPRTGQVRGRYVEFNLLYDRGTISACARRQCGKHIVVHAADSGVEMSLRLDRAARPGAGSRAWWRRCWQKQTGTTL